MDRKDKVKKGYWFVPNQKQQSGEEIEPKLNHNKQQIKAQKGNTIW